MNDNCYTRYYTNFIRFFKKRNIELNLKYRTGEKLREGTEGSFERFELVEDIDPRNNLGRIFSGKVKYLMIETIIDRVDVCLLTTIRLRGERLMLLEVLFQKYGSFDRKKIGMDREKWWLGVG